MTQDWRESREVAAWLRVRRFVRKACGAGTTTTICIIPDSNSEPELLGESFHWENKSGDRIHHPSAYRKAWWKPIYVASTIRVEVGERWLIEHCEDYDRICILKLANCL